MSFARNILVAALLAAVPVVAWGQAKGKSQFGSQAQQLLLSQALDKVQAGTLVAELNKNKQAWGTMPPEQLRELRNRYYAFLKQDPAKQAELIESSEAFHKLSKEQQDAFRQTAAWLKKVVDSLSAEQRQQLMEMTPEERAKRLLELKAKLVDAQPVTRPATQPASVDE